MHHIVKLEETKKILPSFTIIILYLLGLPLVGLAQTNVDTIPKLVERALVTIESNKRWRFAMQIQEGKNRPLKVRFDPETSSGVFWSAIDPKVNELAKDQLSALKNLQTFTTADKDLVYAWLREIDYTNAAIVHENIKHIIFFVPLVNKGIPEAMRGHLDMTATYNKNGNYIEKIVFKAPKSFKLSFSTKVIRAQQTFFYEPLDDNGSVLLVREELDAKFSAFFITQSQKTTKIYSNFEAIR